MLPKTIFEKWVHPGHGIHVAVSIYIIISVFLWSVASPPPKGKKPTIAVIAGFSCIFKGLRAV